MHGIPSLRTRGRTCADAGLVLAARRYESLFMLRNREARPSGDMIAQAADHLTRLSGVLLSSEDMGSILSLYPRARIMLAVAGGPGRVDVKDALAHAIADFFVGEPWPVDPIDNASEAFTRLLRQQAFNMGFDIR